MKNAVLTPAALAATAALALGGSLEDVDGDVAQRLDLGQTPGHRVLRPRGGELVQLHQGGYASSPSCSRTSAVLGT